MKPVKPGLKHAGRVWARPADLASAIGNAGVDVVSSPATIGYLEMACVHAIQHLFEPGEASVGVGFDLRHVGAASPDRPVETQVELIETDGRRLVFEVRASQGDRPIMTGTHQRALVELERLLKGVRAGQAGDEPLILTGRSLSPGDAADVAYEGRTVEIAPQAMAQLEAGRKIVEQHLREGVPVYGLNTGLGARVGESLSDAQAADFSRRPVRGRAQAVGDLLPRETVRAAMCVRLNTLLGGEAGVSRGVAEALAAALNGDIVPAVPAIASIGAGDLTGMASLVHALTGEGEVVMDGACVAAADALAKAGLAALELGPKDGLALVNNPSLSVALAVSAGRSARHCLGAMHVAAGLCLEGFRANAGALRAAVARVHPQAGEVETAAVLLHLLEGGDLLHDGAARRLQDPLSFRCAAQTLGAARASLDQLESALAVELNHSADNPAVLPDEGRVVSTGSLQTVWLARCLDQVSRSLAHAANDAVSRMHRLCSPEFSGLPPLLSSAEADRAGFGPLLKPVESLRAEIVHLSAPVPVMPSFNAGGAEDAAPLTPLAAQNLTRLCDRLALLTAYELVAGAQAVELARPRRIGARLQAARDQVRELCRVMDEDRPIGREVEAIAETLIMNGRFAALHA